MKQLLIVTFLMVIAVAGRSADVIAQWNFNSSPADASTSTGSTNASTGAGSPLMVGGTTYTFATGHTNDPAATDNTGINLANFPPQATSNKTAGIRFAASTVGYQNIVISWAQRVSNTGSKYHRFFYSLDGNTFVETTNVINLASNNTFFPQFVDLSAISGATNNPNFAFQIVSEFEGSAIGNANNNYVTTTTLSYSGNGTARFDMMTVSGDPLGAVNSAPTISSITNVTMRANTTYPAIPFTVSDVETPAVSLVVVQSSSNPTLLPTNGIVLQGDAESRTVTLTPAPNQSGSANVTLVVRDAGGRSNSTVFAVTVIPTNTPPTISAILNQSTIVGTPTAPIAFTIGDAESAASNLTVTAVSSNTLVLPQSGISLSGTGSSRTITLTPAAGEIGSARVNITISDGILTTNRAFTLAVVPSVGTLLYEPFSYNDGPLIEVSSFLWNNHGGNTGQLQVISRNLYLVSDNSEDVNARLRGEPYSVASGTNLYYSFRFALEFVPSVLGDYFAHFKDNGTTFRARLFVSTTNATAPELGAYRLGIANGAGFPTNAGYAEVPMDLFPGETNLIVVRYNVGTGVSTLWLNPSTQASTSYAASDFITSTNSVTQFAFRESSFIGAVYVDDLRVTTTFNEALGILPPPAVPLKIVRSDSNVIISWPSSATGFSLQRNTDLNTTDWQSVTPSPVVIGNENVVTNSAAVGNAFFRLKN